MADASGSRRGARWLGVLVGALLMAFAGMVWMVWSGRALTPDPASLAVDIRIPEPPTLPRPAPAPRPQPAPPPMPGPPPLR